MATSGTPGARTVTVASAEPSLLTSTPEKTRGAQKENSSCLASGSTATRLNVPKSPWACRSSTDGGARRSDRKGRGHPVLFLRRDEGRRKSHRAAERLAPGLECRCRVRLRGGFEGRGLVCQKHNPPPGGSLRASMVF